MSHVAVGCNGFPDHNSLHTDILVAVEALEAPEGRKGDKSQQIHRVEGEAAGP